MAAIESGAPCGAGLDEFGLAPERLLTVSTARLSDLLWTMEEALHSPAIRVVIGEVRHQAIDAVALRRLSLAAASHGALALLLRATPPDDISTAATRWVVRAAASSVTHGPGPPWIEAQLVRNRRGPLGSWTLEWSESDERFVLASTHAQPVAAAASDRPSREVA
jgi:protein ImuA